MTQEQWPACGMLCLACFATYQCHLCYATINVNPAGGGAGNGWGFDKKHLSKLPVRGETNISQMYQKGPTWG